MASNSAEVKVIRGLINDWYAALGRGDAAGLATAYADDVVAAGLAPPLWTRGKHKYIENMKGWFDTFVEPLKGEPEELSIVAGDSVAFVNGFSHIVGKKKDGARNGPARAANLVLRKGCGQMAGCNRACLGPLRHAEL